MSIIKSLLDTDFCKLTMAQAVLHHYPGVIVRYKFICRNNKRIGQLDEIKQEISNLCSLKFTEDELSYLSSFSFFKNDFIEFLRLFQLNSNYIKASIDKSNKLEIDIEGPWISTIFFEIPILSIVSEVYCKYQSINEKGFHSVEDTIKKADDILKKKISYLSDHLKTGQISEFKFADFGTRRRYSHLWHNKVIDELKKKLRSYLFVGTSNVYFAKKYDIKPIGTMSHEWFQAHQQLENRLAESQKMGMETWIKEYRGNPGIVLSDVLGFKAFLNDFDLYFAKLFTGCRHDSGDPVSWCVRLIEHYDKFGIDPKTKHAIFTDGLNFEGAVELHQTFNEMINVSCGIGTNLTNDVGIDPLDIVMQMVECNGRPVVKISDSDNKIICKDKAFVARLKKEFNI